MVMKEAAILANSGVGGFKLAAKLKLASYFNDLLSAKDPTFSLGPAITLATATCAAEHLAPGSFTFEGFQSALQGAEERRKGDLERLLAFESGVHEHNAEKHLFVRGDAQSWWKATDRELKKASQDARDAYDLSHDCRTRLATMRLVPQDLVTGATGYGTSQQPSVPQESEAEP